jgi:hypothetical protein
MAARRTARKDSKPRSTRRPQRRETKLAFEALAIEGGLLSPDWLARVAALDADGQSEADYRVPKGLQLRDEISRYWRIAQAYWSEFAAGRANAATPEVALALSERFVLALLRESFGFASLTATPPLVIAERSYPLRFAALDGRVPVVIAPAGLGLDTLSPAFGDGGRRRSAFGLAQESLNAAEGATWGLATDGFTLRIVRDNASLTRPAWIEADLARIFTEERYSDFAALWLLAHETRFGRADQLPTECALETWRDSGREEGTRAREYLRTGVEEALLVLGQGFLAHSENSALRTALQDGSLSTMAYFQELLRLVYRLIFLLTVEERGLLHPESSEASAQRLYAEGYSLRRLRERSVRRSAHDRFFDLWEAAKIVFRGLAAGESRLALPALAGLFALTQCPTLDAANLENHSLLLAMFRLSWLREFSGLMRVNWRDMGPEELGSVYESLLELVPQIAQGGRVFAFATGGETKGNARKTSGSYYTPESLVQVLLESALEPVVANALAANPERPVEALLDLSVVDPACGSGHFLLAAARRLAGHVARFQANGTPSAAEYRHALRQVVGRCLYGIDLNPMAVELCKVSLWMEAVEPGLPLTFLDAHIRHGNALLGTTPELMAEGIPDAAWEPIEGDDRKVASGLKKRNKRSEGGQRALDTLWTKPTESEAVVIARAIAELESAPDTDVEALARKEERWEDLLDSEAYRHQKLVADTWCAAFVWPKQPGPLQDAAPTNDIWLQIRDRRGQPSPLAVRMTEILAQEYRFFHWHLAFPQVFARGGFDVVLGNPPWERLKVAEKEWFADQSPEIASAPNTAARQELVEALKASSPGLLTEFRREQRRADGESHFLRHGSDYPLCARGDINLYAVFAERMRNLLGPRGLVGALVPTGIATDETTRFFFQEIIESGSLVSLFDFENRDALFPAVHRSMKFCLLTIARGSQVASAATCVFFAHSTDDLRNSDRRFVLTAEDVRLLNPLTRTCPVICSRKDAEILKTIHRQVGALGQQSATGDWRLEIFQKMIDVTIHSKLCSFTAEPPNSDWLPVYEGRSIRLYNHRASTYLGVSKSEREAGQPRELTQAELEDPTASFQPATWVSRETFEARLGGRSTRSKWFPSIRYVTNATNERTVVVAVRPFLPSNNKLSTLFSEALPKEQLCLIANLGSLALDYVARQKTGGTTLGGYIVQQLPVHSAGSYGGTCRWTTSTSLRDWIAPRVLELTYTAWDLESFARDVGCDGPPFRWDLKRRFLLRAELDAAFFHLYSLSHAETSYILDTFPIVRKHDEKEHGEYRTKRVILEIYDAMAEAARTGQPYATGLNPPPADPRVAHPSRIGVVVPFPSRTSVRLPEWDEELFDDVARRAQVSLDPGAWGTSLSGERLGMTALAAVLRNLPEPRARENIERAVVLALLPRLMLPNLDSASAKTWRSIIGRENLNVTSVSTFAIPWNAVIRKAIQQNVLAEEANGRWCAGVDIADAPSPVLDARTLVALAWLATAPAEDAEVTTQIGDLRAA